MHRLVLPFHTPQSYELAISRARRWGWVYCAQLYPSSLASVISTSAARMQKLTPSHSWPSTSNFLPLIQQGCSGKTSEGHGRYSTLFVTFSVLYYLGCVPLGQWWHTCLLSLHVHAKKSASCRSDEKKSVLVEDLWASSLLVLHEVQGDAISNLAFHFIWFFLPLILHFPLHLVGVSFSQDKVTCFQQNGISLSVIVPLLSLSLRCGQCFHFLEGFSQLFT